MNAEILYLITFAVALFISLAATPLCRVLAKKFNVLDKPISKIKTHKVSTPYLGGIAIALGWVISLFIIRYATDFPNGTLRSLRGIMIGAFIVLLLGLIDDIKFKGLGFKSKFLIQFAAACVVVFGFDIRINFISVYWLSCLVSVIWIMGITNAFNIIDIMDGLSSGIAVIASLAFLFISLPTEEIYVNFCAIALAGAILGFMPYNLSKSKKIFMGDTGSLFIGFILASLSMGTKYTALHEVGLLAPLLILAIPIYEVFLVSWFRIRKGILPFMGSKDHYALRLEMMGLKRKNILLITYGVGIALSVCAYLLTKLDALNSLMLSLFILICLWMASMKLASVKVD